MILLYTAVLLALGVVHWVLQRRAGALSRAYSAHAGQVLKLLQANAAAILARKAFRSGAWI